MALLIISEGSFDVNVRGALANNRQINNPNIPCILGDNPEAQKTIESMIFLRLTIDNIFEFAPCAHHARAAKRKCSLGYRLRRDRD